jgi:hypothetical protein
VERRLSGAVERDRLETVLHRIVDGLFECVHR